MCRRSFRTTVPVVTVTLQYKDFDAHSMALGLGLGSVGSVGFRVRVRVGTVVLNDCPVCHLTNIKKPVAPPGEWQSHNSRATSGTPISYPGASAQFSKWGGGKKYYCERSEQKIFFWGVPYNILWGTTAAKRQDSLTREYACYNIS